MEKNFLFPDSTLDGLSNDYIDRPKSSEQKNPFVYIVPRSLKWVGTKKSW